ncbi:MAG: hypothetical protein JW776_01135 [Candidatus Lokiarchaeota archaeon]|nr:hypothetical protein [Candidatus Lokiarchaeota archaeon]
MIVLQPEYPEISHFSLLDDDGEEYHQLVVYSKEILPKFSKITLVGRMVKSEGEAKHPNSAKHKYNYEYQFIADKMIKK